MSDEVLIHVGLPKTGTTYLQTILWRSREQLRHDGVLLPGAERRDHLWASREVRGDDGLDRLPPAAAGAWTRLREEIAAWPGRALISHEFFAGASADQAVAMVEALAPARVRVAVTAREPLGLFTASWQESLKNRATTPIATYSREVSDDPMQIWNWRTLDLRLVLERWREAVPLERIHVLPVDTGARREDLWDRFAGLLGLDPASYDVSGSFPNESMGVVEAEALRRVNQQLDRGRPALPHGFRSAFDRGVYLRTFLADERLVPRRGERFWPPDDRIAECRERGERAAAYVREHGFPVVGDVEALRVPAELAPRRTPESVTDAEVADVATWLVARMLDDVRTLREESRRAAPGGTDPGVGVDLSQELRRRVSSWIPRSWRGR